MESFGRDTENQRKEREEVVNEFPNAKKFQKNLNKEDSF